MLSLSPLPPFSPLSRWCCSKTPCCYANTRRSLLWFICSMTPCNMAPLSVQPHFKVCLPPDCEACPDRCNCCCGCGCGPGIPEVDGFQCTEDIQNSVYFKESGDGKVPPFFSQEQVGRREYRDLIVLHSTLSIVSHSSHPIISSTIRARATCMASGRAESRSSQRASSTALRLTRRRARRCAAAASAQTSTRRGRRSRSFAPAFQPTPRLCLSSGSCST